jgi:AAA+ superfamily predicted ATPase
VGAGIVAGPVEAIAERGAAAVRALTECRSPVVLIGTQTWDPQWSRSTALMLDALVPSTTQRARLWENALNGDTPGFDAVAATSQFRLNPEQVWRAAHSARLMADAKSEPLAPFHLQAGARAQNGAGLERLARRIAPKVEWDDLVLTPQGVVQLREIVARIRHREKVLGDWGMGQRSSKGQGVKVLFAGDSGTGKTISAEVIAHTLGLDLYVIDLATVVDKYIGETEKHLDRIFSEADQVNGVLLFDEADALFGKRSDVKDAHDRYANVEVAYLLQRMESFDGLAILTTNLRSNLDDAFLRRLDAIVDFPMPEDDDRRRLWVQHLAPGVPRADDVDLDFLARAFRISGGNIRNVVFGAAYLAAADNRPVGMVDLVRATEREYRKLGHLCLESEFGRYFGMLSPTTNGAP